MVIQLNHAGLFARIQPYDFLLEQSALPGGFSADLDPTIMGVKENETRIKSK